MNTIASYQLIILWSIIVLSKIKNEKELALLQLTALLIFNSPMPYVGCKPKLKKSYLTRG